MIADSWQNLAVGRDLHVTAVSMLPAGWEINLTKYHEWVQHFGVDLNFDSSLCFGLDLSFDLDLLFAEAGNLNLLGLDETHVMAGCLSQMRAVLLLCFCSCYAVYSYSVEMVA